MVLIFSLSLTACQSGGSSKQWGIKSTVSDEEKIEKATPVEVQQVTRGPITSSISAVAILAPKEKASVRSLVSGLIKELLVEEGTVLKKNQKIAKLTRPGAQSLIQKARIAYQKARRDVKRLQELVKKGLVPQEELIQAKFARDQNALELRRLREEAKHETLVSPINGVVVKRPVYQGESVNPGQLVVEIMDLSEVYAPLKLPDRWAMKVKEGMLAHLLDRDGQLLSSEASITHVSPIIDAETGTFSVWVTPTNPPSLHKTKKNKKTVTKSRVYPHLKPGLFVTVELILDRKESALLVPRQAVLYKDGRPMISQVVGDRVKIHEVVIGYEDKKHIEILSPLREGDWIISFGQRGLEQDALIKSIKPKTVTNKELTSEVTGPIKKLKR